MIKVRLYYCFYCCLLSSVLFAQTNTTKVKLQYQAQDASIAFITDTLHLQTNFVSIIQCKQYVEQLPVYLHRLGFIAASIDSVHYFDTAATAYIFIGKKYTWKVIGASITDEVFRKQLKQVFASYSGKVISTDNFVQFQDKLLQLLENNGYPFAAVGLDSITIINQQIQAQAIIEKGITYPLDTIHQVGNTIIGNRFLHKYLGLKKGSLFSIVQLQQIDQQLAELPYLKQVKPWDLQMLASSYNINLYLQSQKSNRINVLLGFLPANQQLGGKLLFTGEANILLNNSFAKGETISLNWQQLQTASPRLQLMFKQPYFLNSQFGVQFNFELYKRDSAFLNLQAQLAFQYAVNRQQKISVALQQFTTNMLTVDTLAIISNKKLPDVSDMQITNIAVSYVLNNTNYTPNPLRGKDAAISFSIGNKQIGKNNTILSISNSNFNYKNLYDTVNLNSYQLKLQLQYAQYFQLGKQSVFKSALQVGWLQSDSYFRNELFQIGGNKLLRGFDEESILANQYAVVTTEYRYLLGKNAFFAGFADVGFTNNAITRLQNQFIGGGIGLALETKQGIFNISYAAGKRNDLPFSLRQSKIHIGFISVF